MLNTKKLRADIKSKLNAWDEKSSFTMKGVRNLSRCDMDTLDIMCDIYEQTESLSGYLLVGGVKEVLKKYGLEV
jgi:hypothetical protein